MEFQFNIQVTDTTIKKGYAPTIFKAWVTPPYEKDGQKLVDLQTQTIETLTGEENGNGRGTRVEDRSFTYPAAIIQSLITGYDLETSKPIMNVQGINQLLSIYNLEVVE